MTWDCIALLRSLPTVALLLLTGGIFAQNQDCSGYEVLCGQDSIKFTPPGTGSDDFANPDNQDGCLSGESRSAWYYFESLPNTPPGTLLSFVIATSALDTDYDFAIWGPVSPGGGDLTCDNLGEPIRCNYSEANGDTGLRGSDGFDDIGEFGDTYSNELIINEKQGFYLMIDNYDDTADGFAFNWGAGSRYLNCYADPHYVSLGCGNTFMPPGRAGEPYLDTEPVSYLICPDDPNVPIALTFTEFDLRPAFPDGCADLLTVYDGPDSGAPILGEFCAGPAPGRLVATNPTGCLFVTFEPDGVSGAPSWVADISCPLPCIADCNDTQALPCDDGDDCTRDDVMLVDCNGGVCLPCVGTEISCAESPTNTVACDDGDATTTGDVATVRACDGQVCVPCAGRALDCTSDATATRPCDDGDPCTGGGVETYFVALPDVICEPCRGVPLGCGDGPTNMVACDDGDPNTVNDQERVLSCDGTICVPCSGRPTNCADDATITRPCDDGDPCTGADEEVVLTSDGTVCQPCAGVPLDCASDARSRPCDDGNANTVGDVESILACDNSICTPCAGTPTTCAGDPTLARPCDDDNDCTINDEEIVLASDGSICQPCAGTPLTCDGQQTTISPCDDGSILTINDVEITLDCDGSVCLPCTGESNCPEWVAIAEVVSPFEGRGESCSGERDASVAVTLFDSPFRPYRYRWSTGATTPGLSDIGPGVYYVTVTDSAGCAATDSVTVVAAAPVTLDVELSPITCFGLDNGSVTLGEVLGGVPPYTYEINEERFDRPMSVSPLGPGIITARVMDANGCSAATNVIITAPEELFVDLGRDTILRLGDSLLITPTTNAAAVDSFLWGGVDCPGCPSVEVRPLGASRVSLRIETDSGCLIEADRRVGVDQRLSVFVPNAFSPNGDNVNDRLFPFTDASVSGVVSFRVFDRWGALVWSGQDFPPNDPTSGWDGTVGGRALKPAVYVYSMEVLKISGDRESFAGDFVLVR